MSNSQLNTLLISVALIVAIVLGIVWIINLI